jgi:hypothetical protein
MNASEGGPISVLTPEAAALVETYFARVHGALLLAAAGECEEAVDDLRTHVLEQLAEGAGGIDDVTTVLTELGPPEALAAEYAEASRDDGGPCPPGEVESVRLHGRLLGVPYDVRMPNTERIAIRWWNPLDPRIFVPRVFGLGWDINFGALAVRTHLVRPDDEDEPFAAVPERIIGATLAIPLVLSVALVALVASTWPTLPAQLPSHWNIAGQPDAFWDRGTNVVFLALMGLVPAALAASVHLRRRPALNRVSASVFAAFLGTLALSQFAQVLYFVRGDQSQLPTFVGLGLAFVVPLAVFVSMSRIGRSGEMRRDLRGSTKKERVG